MAEIPRIHVLELGKAHEIVESALLHRVTGICWNEAQPELESQARAAGLQLKAIMGELPKFLEQLPPGAWAFIGPFSTDEYAIMKKAAATRGFQFIEE